MNAIFVTVRTGSTRLPKKALIPIAGRYSIECVIDQAKKSKKADQIILCTTDLPEDRILCEIAEFNGIHYFRGSSEDKLVRWRDAARKFNVHFFVCADGDDLLAEPELFDLAFDQHYKTGAHYIDAPNVPCGAFNCAVSPFALEDVCNMKATTDTEMVSRYFKETGFKCEELQDVPMELRRPEIRMTLDYEDDLKFFKNVFNHFKNDFDLRDVIEYLDENPQVARINAYLQARFISNQLEKTKLVLHG